MIEPIYGTEKRQLNHPDRSQRGYLRKIWLRKIDADARHLGFG